MGKLLNFTKRNFKINLKHKNLSQEATLFQEKSILKMTSKKESF